MFDPIAMLISGVFFVISMLAGSMLKRRFAQYSEMPIQYSGKEIAEKMLRENGIYDVKVISVGGQLTDHYNPENKTVNLSEVVYNERNIAAAAVAAHECGHAVQHATAYSMLTFRSKMVPVVQISANFTPFALIAGGMLLAATGSPILIIVALGMFAATTLFSIVTLPVEFDASNRALAWLNASGTLHAEQNDKARNALWWAATTYVVAALASLANLLYYLLRYLPYIIGGRNDD